MTLALVATLLAALFIAGAPTAEAAATCTLTTTAPVTNWSDTTKWSGCAGSYPGFNTGDTAVVNLGSFTLNVDVGVPNSVIVQINGFGVAMTVPAGSSLTVEPSSTLGSGGSTVDINGGAFAVNGPGTLTSLSPITLNSGALTLTGNLTMSGANFTFNGGTVSGAGKLTIPALSSSSFSGSGGPMVISGATVDDFGTINFTSAGQSLSINSGGHVKVESGAFVNLVGNDPIPSDGLGGASIDIVPGGTLAKSGGISNTISAAVNNGGTISLPSTGLALVLSGGGTHTGSFSFASAGSFVSFDGTHTFNAPWSWSAPSGATFHVLGGTSTINSPLTVSDFVQDGGTVNGSGSLTVNNTFNWTGGIQGGTAPSTILTATCTGTLNGSLAVTMDNGRTLGLQGVLNYGPIGAAALNINNGSQLSISGASAILNLVNDAPIKTNNVAISRLRMLGSGRISKTAGTVSQIGVPIAMTAGDSLIAASGTTISLTAGTIPTLSIDSATLNESALNSVIEFVGGTFNINSPNLMTISNGTGTFRVGGTAVLVLGVGTLSLPSHFVQDGTSIIRGPGGLSTSAIYDWSSGTLDGVAAVPALTINLGGTLNIFGVSPTSLINHWGIVNFGAINVNPSAFSLAVNSGSYIANNGGSANFNLLNTNGLPITSDNVAAPFAPKIDINNGTVTKSGLGTIPIDLPFNLAGGTLNVSSGVLQLRGGGNEASPINVAASGTLDFNAGGFFTTNVMGGAGIYSLSGTAFLNLSAPVSCPTNFIQTGTGSVLNSTGFTLTIAAGSTYKWNGGTIFGGTLALSGGSLLIDTTLSGANLDGGCNLNYTSGTMVWAAGTNPLTIKQNAVMNLSALFDIQTAANLDAQGVIAGSSLRIRPTLVAAGFINVNSGGTLQKSTSGGQVLIGADVTNNAGGTINVLTGLLALSGPDPVTHGGTFSVASPAILDFSGATTHTITLGSTVSIAGILKIHGSTVDLAPNISPANFDMASGTLTGSGNVNTTSAFVWDGGTMSGSGTTTVAAGSATLSSAIGAMTLARPLVIASGATGGYSGPSSLTITTGGSLTNNGAFNSNTPNPIQWTGAPAGNISNGAGGTFSMMNATNDIYPPFTNAGTVLMPVAGTTIFRNGYTQSAGTTTTGPGNVSVPTPATLVINGGILNGTGSIQAAVTNGGSLNPGTSPGIMSINGSYTQTAAGTMNIDLNGITPGTLYDQLNVTGPVTLNGTLNVILGYTPVNGDTFNVVTGTSVSGDFATYVPATFPPNGTIQKSLTATAVQLFALAPSADLGVTKVLSGGAIIAGSPVVYTITVKNFGPNDATNVTVTDPTPAGLTFNSNSGACTGAFPCTIPLLTAGSTATITSTYSLPSNATGSVTNNVTVAASAPPDLNSVNDSASVGPTAIVQKADLSVTKTGPAMALPNANVIYDVTVTNNGPSVAANVVLGDPTPSRLTFVSATGACASFPCNIGTMTPGQSKSMQAKYTVVAGPTTTIVNTANATTTTPDPNSANNSGSASTSTGCPTGVPSNLFPTDGATNVDTKGVLSWSDVGSSSYTVYLDVAGPNACSKFFFSTSATSVQFAGLQEGTTYQWRVEAVTTGCQTLATSCITFTTKSTCPLTPPTLISPVNTTVVGPATFTWSPVTGAVDYKLTVNGNLIATTNSTSFGPVNVATGPVSWSVTADFAPPCASLQSQTVSFNGCDNSAVPLASVVGQAASGQGFDLSWNIITGATRHEVDESTSPSFSPATTQTFNSPPAHFVHNVNTTTAYYYRVRSFLPCANGFSPSSLPVRVVLTPLSVVSNDPNVSVPVGNTNLVQVVVHVPGFPDGTFPFTATLDKPWLVKVEPSSGLLPPEGIDLTVFADPTSLPNGTFTGTVILSVTTPSSGSIALNGVTPVAAPVSISLVTPVTPKPAGTPPADALIIPSVGHLDGINSHWQSDIRLANVSSDKARYQLTFTPDDISKGVKQTIIDVDPGVTTALDDVIKTWYGLGSLGDTANGVMEIRPVSASGKAGNDVNVSLTAVASSRTYNVTSNGTLGQFIPAVPFASFIGKAIDANHAATILGLQQLAQNDAYRTNFGIVEASGQPASVLVSAFDDSGKKLFDFPISLGPNQQVQLNSFLAQNKITNLSDCRLQVQVVSGEGKVTAYASVIDNRSGDPLLVSGVPLGQFASDHYVLPGVADLNTGRAAWRTDVRIFNPTTSAQTGTLTFYAQNSSGAPQTASVTINPGETRQLDSVLGTLFGAAGANTGGVLHLLLGSPASLVVTGRTYNLTSNGTFGQFIPAVTSADAVGKSDRALQILQAEDSVRYRTNLGIAEVTGKPVTVEVSVVLPDSKVSPSTQIPLAANGFLQVPVIQSLGLTNVYNARISVRVVNGDGKITAYGSVVDQKTQDPTFVRAQ